MVVILVVALLSLLYHKNYTISTLSLSGLTCRLYFLKLGYFVLLKNMNGHNVRECGRLLAIIHSVPQISHKFCRRSSRIQNTPPL